jgi:hypothetical protein
MSAVFKQPDTYKIGFTIREVKNHRFRGWDSPRKWGGRGKNILLFVETWRFSL